MEKILRVDLSNKNIWTEEVERTEIENFLGGMGIATKIFTSEVSPEIDAFDKENYLIFSVGAFIGTQVPFSGRHYVMAKSPLTNIIGEASAGGFWGKELRWTGFNHIVISGKSEEPVYIYINNSDVQIKSAKKLWGKLVNETTDLIINELGYKKIRVACIGPAGENLVKISGIMSDKHRAAARCGLGAVMGSKKLKAIALRGTNPPKIVDEEALNKVASELRVKIKNSPNATIHHEYGTPIGIDALPILGEVPMKNYTQSKWKGSKKIGGEALKKRGVKKSACFGCPAACTNLIEFEGKMTRAPEYETLAMLGTNLLVDDLDSLIKWNDHLDNLGIDTISIGAVIAMYLEAADRNLIEVDYEELGFPKNDDNESEKEFKIWGAKKAIENLIEKIAYREGIGDDLANGVRYFCQKYNLPNELQTHSKGLEVPAHEPRSNNLAALDFATTSRGAYHCYEVFGLSSNMNLKKDIGLKEMINRFNADREVVEAVKKLQDASEAYSCCGGCIFGFHWIENIGPWVKALNAILGTNLKVKNWMKNGERIFNMKRRYSIQCGISNKDDTLGKRFLTPIRRGGTKKNVPPLIDLIPEYYKLRGWDQNGIPK